MNRRKGWRYSPMWSTYLVWPRTWVEFPVGHKRKEKGMSGKEGRTENKTRVFKQGVALHSCNLYTWRLRQKDWKLEASLGYIVSFPSWITSWFISWGHIILMPNQAKTPKIYSLTSLIHMCSGLHNMSRGGRKQWSWLKPPSLTPHHSSLWGSETPRQAFYPLVNAHLPIELWRH